MSSIIDQFSPKNNKTKHNGNKYRLISWMVLIGLLVAAGIIGTSVFSYKWKSVLTEEEQKWMMQHPVILRP